MIQCTIITSTGVANTEAAVNAWVLDKSNSGEDITIISTSMTQVTTTYSVIIFYTSDWVKYHA